MKFKVVITTFVGEQIDTVFDTLDSAFQYFDMKITNEFINRKATYYGDIQYIDIYALLGRGTSRLLIHTKFNKFQLS